MEKKSSSLVVITANSSGSKKSGKAVPIDPVEFTKQFNEIVNVLTDVKASSGKFAIEQMTVGLAISFTGDIGFADAGIQASVQIVLKPKAI